ncbi:hypothetical protein ACLQ25_19455 [Micromonospora sp. DT44]|uniref:hypothetical protein n=1 Tax=Micromonospora sp. DT44 TaxID=3393439 RepID=UPI003CF8C0B1
MAKKMLGKVVAGAALGGASLLVFAPGIAFADGHHDEDGKVYAKPHIVKAGDEVKLLEICPDRQEHAYVWSKVTGKVKLEPARDDRGEDRGEWSEEDDSYDHDDKGKDEHGKDDKGKDHEGKGDEGKDDKGKDDKGKDDKGKGEHGDAQPGGQGGGAAADAYEDEDSKDWKGEEHGQDAQDDEGKKDWESKDEDKKDWESKDEDKKDWESKDEDKKDWESKGHDYGSDDEYGSDKSWESKGHESEDSDYGSDDEYGSDKSWESKGHESEGHDYGSDDEYGSDKSWESKGHESEDSDYGSDKGWDKGGRDDEREFVYYGEAKVDKDAKPGRYELKGSCGEGELVVLPHGGVDGGDGGVSTGTDRGLATGGASLLGAAALGGIVLMRRRRTDGSLA